MEFRSLQNQVTDIFLLKNFSTLTRHPCASVFEKLRVFASQPYCLFFAPKAAGLGFEPRWRLSESRILPLDDPAALSTKNNAISYSVEPDEKESSFLFIPAIIDLAIPHRLAENGQKIQFLSLAPSQLMRYSE